MRLRKLWAYVLRFLAPNYGRCFRCGWPWKWTKYHVTRLSNYSGCFALCEPCWAELTPQDRLPFYQQLSMEWVLHGMSVEECMERWSEIREAVLEGK